jgi:hypothetical protein
VSHPDLICRECGDELDLCRCDLHDAEWYDLTLELQADAEAEDRALREQDQRELDEQQTLDGEDRCAMLD